MGAQTGTCPFHRDHRAEYRRDITSLFSPSPSSLIIFMMLVLRGTRRFLETTELPSPTPHLDPAADRPVLILNHRPTLLGLMISFLVWRLAFPSSPPPLGILMAFICGVEGDSSVQVFSWICCLLRLYTRFFILRAPGWDDLFIILTMVRRPPHNDRILAPLLTLL